MSINDFVEIARIVEDWDDGHHGLFPMILCYNSKATEKPFWFRKGCGFGAVGAVLSLEGLFDKNAAQNFNHDETAWVFKVLEEEVAKGSNGHQTGEALVAAYTERFGKAPESPTI